MIAINKLESILEEDGIIFLSYGGAFTQSLIVGMTGVLEKEVEEADLSMKTSNNIFVVFIELAQNIMNYSKKMKGSGHFDPKGLIYVGKKEGEYFVCSQNIISTEDKEKLQEMLTHIQSLDESGIKKLYKETRRSGKTSHAKGGGLGFLEIAKKVKEIKFRFEEIEDERYYFKFCAVL
jgi:CRISPR/Cas system CSM-associated protein Csm2 small subunit